MGEHPIQGLMKTAMENIKEMVDVNTIIGDPVETPDGSVIIPVSKVGFGFAAGGSEFETQQETSESGRRSYESDVTRQHGNSGKKGELPFGGGSGGGISITPVAFLVVGKQGIRSITLQGQTHLYERMMDLAPAVVEKIQGMIRNKDSEKKCNSGDKSGNEIMEELH
ncbi:GerW family sporulation protein [Aneurinibacillus thermoaerophilus]|uniref:GerW family sporulation protein n=1 Tax=Aneurinibacillus thermoaerophilus TaxID=143495 RepID=UPI002E24EF46|nr:GerW family sporulation protein [Aneurinibacillus thermoaerophilus]MED0679424.1 GerW family sporulation protein [Aneurinibacillus thermoaerophilus]MED0764320.1 GerW family sporulation protein [Aneurinibacillus thermoaerophilus]